MFPGDAALHRAFLFASQRSLRVQNYRQLQDVCQKDALIEARRGAETLTCHFVYNETGRDHRPASAPCDLSLLPAQPL